jgi:hypothetical protein
MTTRRHFLVAGALGALSVRSALAQGCVPRVGIIGVRMDLSRGNPPRRRNGRANSERSQAVRYSY